MGSNFQTGIHGFGGSKGNNAEQFNKPNGAVIYNFHKYHNPKKKMAESLVAKIINLIGLPVYIIGILSNIFSNMNAGLSIALGLVGGVWMVFRALKMREDWIIRKIEKKNMQDHIKRYNKKHPL